MGTHGMSPHELGSSFEKISTFQTPRFVYIFQIHQALANMPE